MLPEVDDRSVLRSGAETATGSAIGNNLGW